MTGTLEVSSRPLALQLAQDCDLSDAARDLLTKEIKVPQYLAALARAGLWMDALQFAPFGLPRREAAWWACLCLWQCYRPVPSKEVDACLRSVVNWLQEPNETTRRATYDAAQVARVTSPAGNLAMGVFMNSGSLSVAGQPEVPAEPRLLPKSLANAVTLAIRKSPRETVAARQNDFVRLALEVFVGRWPIPQQS